jgi:hypothetical protein
LAATKVIRKGQKKPLSPKEAGKTTTPKEIDKTIE